MPQDVAPKPGAEELATGLLLYTVEMVADPGAAEDLIAEATARTFRWSEPDDLPAAREALFKAVTAGGHTPLNRPGRPQLPAALRNDPERFDAAVEAALAGLGGRERAALYLVAVERMPYDQAANVLGTTVVNAGHLVWRARKTLRDRLVGAAPASGESGVFDAPVPSTEQRISRVLRAGCVQAGPFISAYLDNQLSARQREVLEPHLASCGICSEERARLDQATSAVRTHWKGLAGRLTATGWTRRVLGTMSMGRRARARGPRGRRMQLGAVTACMAGLVILAALWAAFGRGSVDAVTSIEGQAERSKGRIRASGPAVVRFLDGSEARLESGSSLSAERGTGGVRPKVKLLCGSAEMSVAPGAGELVVDTAAGSCRTGSGIFRARLAARDTQGEPIKDEIGRARALMPGEHLSLVIESQSASVAVSGHGGKDLVVSPGSAGLVPVSEAPRPLAIPGCWVGLQPGGGDEPAARTGGALGCERGSGLLALFGGLAANASTERAELNDLWTYDPALGAWQEISVTSNIAEWTGENARRPTDRPAPQAPGALLSDARGRGLWLYSGRLAGADLAETWLLDLPSHWQRMQDYVPQPEPKPAAPPTGGKAPAPAPPRPAPVGRARAALAASAQAGGVVLFGGELGGRPLNDLWLFETATSTWKPLVIKGVGPDPRSGAAMAADKGGRHLYVFGGRTSNGSVQGDLWQLDLDAAGGAAWQRVTLRGGAAPESRYGAAMACDESTGKLVLFGGRPRLGGPLPETWVFEPDVVGNAPAPTGRWRHLTSAIGPAPDEFTAPAMVWSQQCRMIVLYSRGGLWGLRLEK